MTDDSVEDRQLVFVSNGVSGGAFPRRVFLLFADRPAGEGGFLGASAPLAEKDDYLRQPPFAP